MLINEHIMNFFYKQSNPSQLSNLSKTVDKEQSVSSAAIDSKKTANKIDNQVKSQIQNQANVARNPATQKSIKTNSFALKPITVNQPAQTKNANYAVKKPIVVNQPTQNQKNTNKTQIGNLVDSKKLNLSTKSDAIPKTKLNIKFKIQNFIQSIKPELILKEIFDFFTLGFIFNLFVKSLSHLFIKHLIYFKKSIFNIYEYLLVAILGALLSILHFILFLQSIFKNSKNQKQFEFKLLIVLITQLIVYFLIGLIQFYGQMSYWDHKHKVLPPYDFFEIIKLSTEMAFLLILILKCILYLRKKLSTELKTFFIIKLS